MKNPFILANISLATFLTLTTLTSAEGGAAGVQAGMGTFADLINTFNQTVVKALGTLFMSSAVVAFFYGLARFIWGLREGETKSITNGKQFMIWSITALFVMFSVYGIIRFFQSFVPGLNQNTITIPEINYGGSGSSGSSVGSGGTSGTSGSGVGSGGTSGTSGSGVGSGGTSGTTGDSICFSYGPGTGCTTSTGLTGICDSGNICQPNNDD